MLETVGEQLKKARLERQLTLEQASHVTRIRVHFLEALENDQRAALPSPVQGRGFLRLYADYLGLPLQPLLDQWEGRLPPEPQPEPAVESAAEEMTEQVEPPAEETQPEPVAMPVEQEEPPQLEEQPEEEVPAVPAPPTPSSRIYEEIGAGLRRQRETLSLSQAEVERYLHIRQRYLQALENGRIDELPSPVQARGMLSNYASFLGLNADDLLLRFAEGLQSARVERIPAPPPPQPGLFRPRKPAMASTSARGWRRFLTPDLIIGTALVLTLVGIGIYSASQVTAIRLRQQQATAPALADVLLITGSPTPGLTETPQPAGMPTASAPEDRPQPGTGENIAAQATGTQPVLNSLPLQLYVVANQRAFLRVIADGKVAFNGRTVPGNAYPFSGKDQIELVTGNAAALQVFFNQNDLGILGINGQVVRLLFNKNGVITPTPAFSATPTATLPATATLAPTATRPSPTITPLIP